MALIDTARDLVIIRVVYDGPPLSGKTTSLHALQTVLKTDGTVFSPEEQDGRTQYFDWLEYTGGLFEGRRILAQIISVPGQPALQGRRNYLLDNADAIVFVADSRASGVALSAEYFRDMQSLLKDQASPPPLLIQANHQDGAGAMEPDALKLFFPPEVRVMPSVATEHSGVREIFVTAISLAMEKVKNQLKAGADLYGSPTINNGENLLSALQNDAGDASEEALVLETFLNAELEASEPETHFTPASAPRGGESLKLPQADCHPRHVFPTQTGKRVLRIINEQNIPVQRQMDGAWVGRNQEWRCYSRSDWCYASEAEAAQALRQHIRTHIRLSPVLAETRVVALGKNGQGQWRLWQITKVRETLSQILNSALQQTTINSFAESMVHCTASLYQAFDTFSRYAPQLPITLESISIDERPVYIGMIDTDQKTSHLKARDVLSHVRDIVADPLGFALADNQLDPSQVWAAVEAMRPKAPQAVSVLQDILAPH